MPVRILNDNEVRALLPMDECIDVIGDVLAAKARGQSLNPLRTALRLPAKTGLLGMMPSYLADPESMGIKVVSVMPGNHGGEFDSHQGVVLLFETKNGCLLCIADASEITAIRTAAASGIATRLLARKDAKRLAILGSGVQASSHLRAMCCVRPIERVTVWGRSLKRARDFADRETDRHNVPVEAVKSAEEAVASADIVCTTTSSQTPILEGQWIAPGTHINAVGACLPAFRELDTDAVFRSKLYVDARESAYKEAGDFLIPKKEGAITDDHIVGEIGELLLEWCDGRTHDQDMTLFKSLGVGIEDLAATHYIYEKAQKQDVGLLVDMGGRRDAGR